MSTPGPATLTPIAHASQRLAAAIGVVPGLRVITTVGTPIAPPAVVIGPPRLAWRDYNLAGAQPTSAQWNVYLVVSLNQYAIDELLSLVASVADAIERYTPGIVVGSVPGTYPSTNGPLPAYTITVQAEIAMM